MRARTLFALGALPLLGACVATKQDVEELRLDMAQQRAHQDSIFRVLVGRTEAMLDSLSDQNVRLRGDFANRLLGIERQLVQIQELSGANQAAVSDLRRQIEERAAEERRRQQQAAEAAEAGESGGDAGDPAELYEAAQAALRRGSVGTARAGFEEFLRTSPQHRLAPEAQYNIGQSYEQGREVPNAITAYARVVELYPTSGRAPAALLRMGRLELGRGNRTEARTRFNQIVQRYPRAPEAGDARTELQRLGTR
jgi:tol-pal system protein YbgF